MKKTTSPTGGICLTLFLCCTIFGIAQARTDKWVIDSATGAAICDLDGGMPAGSGGGVSIDESGQCIFLRMYWQNRGDSADIWQWEQGWPYVHQNGGYYYSGNLNDFPNLTINGSTFIAPTRLSYHYDGTFNVIYRVQNNIQLTASIFPSTTHRVFFEEWTLKNTGTSSVAINAPASDSVIGQPLGPDGSTMVVERSQLAVANQQLAAGQQVSCMILYTLRKSTDAMPVFDEAAEKAARLAMFSKARTTMVLQCPEPYLNGTLTLAKMRLLESPMESSAGIINTTGSNYYGGMWANDDVEYASPGCPFLGDVALNNSCNTMYHVWLKHVLAGNGIAGSYESYDLHSGTGGRADQDMMLYGLSTFLLAQGNADTATVFWPVITEAVKETKAALNSSGAVMSVHDELEGRYPSGTANLSSSGLAYGGYVAASRLAHSLGKSTEVADYQSCASAMSAAIESYFGATVEGYQTYKYYDTCTILRGWISVPLTMGVMQRKDATIAALFSPNLWFEQFGGWISDAGIKAASTDTSGVSWPRETYYALRAAFQAGSTDLALQKTVIAVRYAMLGANGPYMNEESGDLLSPNVLYMRVIPEGLFGLLPMSLDSFACTPRLPSAWPSMKLLNTVMMGRNVDIVVDRNGGQIRLTVSPTGAGGTIFQQSAADGTTFQVGLRSTAVGTRSKSSEERIEVVNSRQAVVDITGSREIVAVDFFDAQGRLLGHTQESLPSGRQIIDLGRATGETRAAGLAVVRVKAGGQSYIVKRADIR